MEIDFDALLGNKGNETNNNKEETCESCKRSIGKSDKIEVTIKDTYNNKEARIYYHKTCLPQDYGS